MEPKDKIFKLFKLLLVTQLLANCNTPVTNNNPIKFVDSFPVNEQTNLYIYHHTNSFHESAESYFAIGKSLCEVYNDVKKTTFAKTSSYAQIDTVISNIAYISSQDKIEYFFSPRQFTLEIKHSEMKDSIKIRLKHFYFNDYNCQ